MSRFFSSKYASLEPYTPGEQPKERKYIKLNTNESPYPPSALAVKYVSRAAEELELYSDPECRELRAEAAKYFGVSPDELVFTNGSDEILNFAFMAFCDKSTPAVFPDITYGFYPVFAELGGIPYTEIPLADDFTVDPNDYIGQHKTIFIANPNAPTGIVLPLSDIRRIIEGNPDNVVVIDEAYVDFGAESCVPLIHEYRNLLVTQTFSKSRSMAGARLGIGIASAELIADLNAIRYFTNPYNVNSMTLAAGLGALRDDEYTKKNCESIRRTREDTAAELKKLGFTPTPSGANFLFAKHPEVGGEEIYLRLKEKGILVRHFSKPRIRDYNRITVGTPEQMQTLLSTLRTILEENQ